MHDNAQIASANFETFSLFEICSSLQRSGSMGGGNEGAREKLIETVALNINRKIHGPTEPGFLSRNETQGPVSRGQGSVSGQYQDGV